jgi:steroid 5-alpha reductase family enzyme
VTVSGLPDLLLVAGSVVVAAMVVLWAISLMIRNASIVDLFWGFGFVLMAWVSWLAAGRPSGLDIMVRPDIPVIGRQVVGEAGWVRGSVLLVLVTVWGLRLTGYLAWRNIGKGEDFRYAAMRDRWGPRFPLVSLGTVFVTQGILMWVVSLPVLAGMVEGGRLGVIAVVGVALWGTGIVFETVGDAQLARFKADPSNAGKVMDRGLWAYTRHPNYFGDFCVWWGIYLVAFTVGTWWTVVGPATMTILLVRFSGVATLERTIATRRPGYTEYVRRTNAFFPGPRRAT